MKRSTQSMTICTTAVAVLLVASFATAGEKKDIVDTAVKTGSFKTLAAALGAADLVGALKGDGPFTVFAPTDEAFSKLPAGTVEMLLKPENKDQLIAVLTYHVVPGNVPAKQVIGLKGAKTLNGQRVDIAVNDGKVTVDKANVIKTDIGCSNGTIHVVDSVLLPCSDNIVTVASKAGAFKTLLAAAKAAGLIEALSSKGPLTVFAPTDDAFAKLPAGTVETLLKPANKDELASILKYHVVAGRVYSEDALAANKAETLQGSGIGVSLTDGVAKVNNATLLATDLDASNGVIHVIDSVLLPPEKVKKVSASEAREKIEDAVARGSRTFNAGHHANCAQIYTAMMLELVGYGDQMPEEVVTRMKHVLHKAERTHNPTHRAWTLRHGLIHVYAQMSEQP